MDLQQCTPTLSAFYWKFSNENTIFECFSPFLIALIVFNYFWQLLIVFLNFPLFSTLFLVRLLHHLQLILLHFRYTNIFSYVKTHSFVIEMFKPTYICTSLPIYKKCSCDCCCAKYEFSSSFYRINKVECMPYCTQVRMLQQTFIKRTKEKILREYGLKGRMRF